MLLYRKNPPLYTLEMCGKCKLCAENRGKKTICRKIFHLFRGKFSICATRMRKNPTLFPAHPPNLPKCASNEHPSPVVGWVKRKETPLQKHNLSSMGKQKEATIHEQEESDSCGWSERGGDARAERHGDGRNDRERARQGRRAEPARNRVAGREGAGAVPHRDAGGNHQGGQRMASCQRERQNRLHVGKVPE